jgi:hypothetical protein
VSIIISVKVRVTATNNNHCQVDCTFYALRQLLMKHGTKIQLQGKARINYSYVKFGVA